MLSSLQRQFDLAHEATLKVVNFNERVRIFQVGGYEHLADYVHVVECLFRFGDDDFPVLLFRSASVNGDYFFVRSALVG